MVPAVNTVFQPNCNYAFLSQGGQQLLLVSGLLSSSFSVKLTFHGRLFLSELINVHFICLWTIMQVASAVSFILQMNKM